MIDANPAVGNSARLLDCTSDAPHPRLRGNGGGGARRGRDSEAPARPGRAGGVAAGVCLNLRRDDRVTSTHRGHGHALAKGTGVAGMIAELHGRAGGHCGGKGGSMHIADFGAGMLGANGVVAGCIPIAVGAGLRLLGSDAVVACFFGNGA